MRRLRVALLASALAGCVASCSLPLPSGVQNVGDVPAEQLQRGDIQVRPPGPKAGAVPVDVVRGFLGAQSSAEDRHAIAREFLAEPLRDTWDDAAGVQVYDPGSLDYQLLPAGPGRALVQVGYTVTAEVRGDGSFALRPPARVQERYQLRESDGSWQLVGVPAGLRLTAADRERSFRPRLLYYLAPRVPGSAPHLVPDRVFLPVGSDDVRTLVERLLRPPSQELAGTVSSALVGEQLRSATMNGSGVVTVDLSGVAQDLPDATREAMSAQLVWTLRGLGPSFTGMRLRAGGERLQVPNEPDLQDAGDWDSFDPDGLAPNPPYFFVAARRLRSSGELRAGPATAGDAGVGPAIPVDTVAVTPDRTRVALLARAGGSEVVVRTGPLRGPSYPEVARGAELSSPTWGSGESGLWLLRQQRDIVLVPPDQPLRTVTVVGRPPGSWTSLAVSRDGARVALVAGGQLYVGRVEEVASGPRVVGLSLVLPSFSHGSAVAWSASTELVVLGSLTRDAQAVRVSVDGSEVTALDTTGLRPVQVAASPAGVLVVSDGDLYALVGRRFTRVEIGVSAPAYPG
ncbi:MAG: LpqB family beta-propeller domain-containing protein [Mycobacteriales bacterium]